MGFCLDMKGEVCEFFRFVMVEFLENLMGIEEVLFFGIFNMDGVEFEVVDCVWFDKICFICWGWEEIFLEDFCLKNNIMFSILC